MTGGAIEAHRRGIVTAVSVVAQGRETAHALDALKDVPSLAVGVHLTLVEEAPLLAPEALPSLTRGGRFFTGFREFSMRYFAGAIRMDDVRRELRAQVEAIAATMPVTHLNGHQHLHLLPRIFDATLELASEFNVPYVRIANETAAAGAPLSRRLQMPLLSRFGRRAREALQNHGIASSDCTLGIANAGHHSQTGLVQLLRSFDGTAELVTHPGLDTSSIAEAYDWGYHWDRETEALCDPAVRQVIEDQGIELIFPAVAGR